MQSNGAPDPGSKHLGDPALAYRVMIPVVGKVVLGTPAFCQQQVSDVVQQRRRDDVILDPVGHRMFSGL